MLLDTPLLELSNHILVRDYATGFDIFHPAADLLEDVQVVLDVLIRAVVGESLKERLDLLLHCAHGLTSLPKVRGASIARQRDLRRAERSDHPAAHYSLGAACSMRGPVEPRVRRHAVTDAPVATYPQEGYAG